MLFFVRTPWEGRLFVRTPWEGRQLGWLASATLLVALSGCSTDLGPCDDAAAKKLYYTDTGLPAYGGQALVHRSCGAGSFCHTEYDGAHYGAPAGLEFDLQTVTTAEQTEILRRGQQRIRDYGGRVLATVRDGSMPPGDIGGWVESRGPSYPELPAIDSDDGIEILRNWLACDAPVVERTDARPAGITPVGDIVATVDCRSGLSICDSSCVDAQADPANCGSCGATCVAPMPYCSSGVCAAACPPMTTICGGGCVDTQTHDLHCGGCNIPCASDRACVGGNCLCAGGLSECGGLCVDTQTDEANCGGCGISCGATEKCAGGCVACGTGTSFATDIQSIFSSRCTDCHSGATPAALLDLTAGNARNNLVNQTSSSMQPQCSSLIRVVPGDPASSYLLDKLNGASTICGSSMPAVGAMLTPGEIATIEDWICGGALDN